MKIRFKSEQHLKDFKSASVENLEIAQFMRMRPVEVVKNHGHYYIKTDALDCTIILESERDFFDWTEDGKPSIKSLWDIAQQKKAEYDKAMTEYNKAVMEKLDESTI